MVNPDDLLIFKLREKAKQPAGGDMPAAAVQVLQPPEAAPVPETANRKAAPVIQKVEEPAPVVEAEPEVQGPVPFPAGVRSETAEKKETNTSSYLAGALFVASAVIFGYIIYPQSLFMLGYISQVGLVPFLSAISYAYGITIMNLALVILSVIAGALMFARPEKAHSFSGIVSSLVILAVTFEYLNSNSEYLLTVVIIAFFEIGILAYVSMTASGRAAEIEERRAEEMLWPRVETF